MTVIKRIFRVFLVVNLVLWCTTIGYSQEPKKIGDPVLPDTTVRFTGNQWRFLLEPYFMAANMKGTIGLGNLPDAEVDEDPSDILENLKFGAMIYFEAYDERWAISSDMIYMKLAADLEPKSVVSSGEAEARQLAWEIAGLRKILPWLEGGIGLQLNVLKTELEMTITSPGGNSNRSTSLTETWLDPMIIARVKLRFTSRFSFLLRPSIGGFGIGSDLAWQVQTHLTYRFSKLFQLSAGYRIITIDYENGSGSDRFFYDIDNFGPVIRLGFNF